MGPALNRQLNQMRGMEQFLRTQGLLPAVKVVQPPRQAAAGELPAEVFAAPADVEKKVPVSESGTKPKS